MDEELFCEVGEKRERNDAHADRGKPARLFEFTTRPPEEREARREKAGAVGDPFCKGLIQARNQSKKDQDAAKFPSKAPVQNSAAIP